MRKIAIFGACSKIAHEAARCFAVDGDQFFLTGRKENDLRIVAQDLIARGAAKVEVYVGDASETEKQHEILNSLDNTLGEPDLVLFAYGYLADQALCERDYAEAEKAFRVNFGSVVALTSVFANRFEKRKSGSIAVISSVAGDRGRKSNYYYGSAKGALSIFLQGLRNRLAASSVQVLTIKPGFVDTPMTASLKKGALFAKAEDVGRGVYQAILQRKDVVYLPWFWRYIMLVIRHIPEFVFKKMSI